MQAPDGSIAYVGYDKPFSFNAREWFVLRKDGFVYTHNPIRVETFYIDNHEICHKMNCVNVDAIPSFVLAEEVPYLTLSEDEPSRDDVKYEVNISNDERRPFVYGSSEVNGGGSIVIDGTPHPFEASNGQMVILDDVGVVESVNDIRVSYCDWNECNKNNIFVRLLLFGSGCACCDGCCLFLLNLFDSALLLLFF